MITLKPIGIVKNKVKKPKFSGWRDVVSDIVLNKKYTKALDGIEDYSHALIVFWMDKVRGFKLKHRPQGIAPEVGIFACRCPSRPNPIGITAVKIIKRHENVLKVKGIDVINNTPVIDIKPYSKNYDLIKNPKEPEWVKMLKH